jgi:hypothetical protein
MAERSAKQLIHSIKPKKRPLITRKIQRSEFSSEKPWDELRETIKN